MAKKKQSNTGLPLSTKIEVIGFNNEGDVYKTIKTIEEFNNMKKIKGWIYKTYQLGFSQYKNAIEK